ncbi:hypothetical protein [Haliangium ochraceum]|uniref:hypothetical protein n=1 Tax=Haliangium ochraceum TaxID=80816 RepID=UPI00019BB077|nr:hypothetical protein [Haliangium ochraceum]
MSEDASFEPDESELEFEISLGPSGDAPAEQAAAAGATPGADVPVAAVADRASDEGDDSDESEELELDDDIVELDDDLVELEELAAPPAPAAPAVPRPRRTPRPSTPPPLPPRPPSARMAVPRPLSGSGSGGVPDADTSGGMSVDSGGVVLRASEHSGLMRLPGSGPTPSPRVAAAEIARPAQIDIAHPSALEELQRLSGDERALWAARAETLVTRMDDASEVGIAATLAYELGELRDRHLGDEEGALAAHRRAFDIDPTHRANLWALQRLLQRRGDWASFVDVIDTAALAASDDPQRAQLYLEKAHVFEAHLRDAESARDAYERAAAFDPRSIAALRGLERLCLAAGDLAGAVHAITALAAAVDDPAQAMAYLLDLARLAADSGDLDTARDALERAAESAFDAVAVARERLHLAEREGDAEAQIAALDAWLEADARAPEDRRLPAIEVAAMRRQQARLSRDVVGDLDAAWQFMQAAMAQMPGEAVILADLADLAERVGRYEELAALFQGLEALEGEGAQSLTLPLRRADALLRSGHRAEAHALLDAMARELPGSVAVLALRERDAMRSGDWARLARAYDDLAGHPEQVFVSSSEDAPAAPATDIDDEHRALAAAAATCAGHAWSWLVDDGDAAASSFARALVAVPDYAPAIEGLIALHERRGQLAEAAALLESYAERGDDETRAYRLERLCRLYTELERHDAVLGVEHRLLAVVPAGLPQQRVRWRIEATLARLGRTLARAEALVGLAAETDDPERCAALLLWAARAFESLADGTADVDAAAAATGARGQADEFEFEFGGAGADGDGLDEAQRRAWAGRAADIYREVLTLSPGNRYAQTALIALLRRGARWQALAEARHAEAVVLPDGPEMVLALREAAAILRDEIGDVPGAIGVLRDLLDRMPGHTAAMHELAELLARCGDIDELVDILELESVAADRPATQVLAMLRLGVALERAGHGDQAVPAYRRVLEMAPDAASAQALELGVAPALAAAAVFERADVGGDPGARIEALELLAGFIEGPTPHGDDEDERGDAGLALAAALREDVGWRWLVEVAAEEHAHSAFARALGPEAGAGASAAELPGALLGLALLQARQGECDAFARLAENTATPPLRAALFLRAAALATRRGEVRTAAYCADAAFAAAPEDRDVVVAASEYLAVSEDATEIAEVTLDARIALFERRAELAGASTRGDWDLRRAELLELRGRLSESVAAAAEVLNARPDDLRALELVRRVCERAGDRAGFARATLALARTWPETRGRVDLLREAAAVADAELGDARLAAWVYRRILAEEPGAGEYERALEICREHEDRRAQVEILSARLDWLSQLASVDPQAAHGQVPLLLERARLLRAADNLACAHADLTRLLAIDANHVQGLAALAEVAETRGDAQEAAECWRRYLGGEPDSARRAAAERTLARLLSEQLGDAEGALAQLEQVIKHTPDDLSVRERLVALLVRTESWPRAVRELGELARRRSDLGDQARDRLRMAEILDGRIGDHRGALEQLKTARKLAPTDLEAVRALFELSAMEQKPKVLFRAARDLRTAIAAHPADTSLYERLAEVTALQDDDEAGFFVACALSALGALPEDRREVLARVGPGLGDGPQIDGALAPEDFSKYLSAVRDDGAHLAADVWKLIQAAVSKNLGLDAAGFGMGRGERLSSRQLERDYVLLERAARAIGLEDAEFYVSAAQPALARALALEHPVVCLGADVARGESPAARFALGRCLLDAHLGIGALDPLSDDALLRYFGAAARAVDATRLPPDVDVAGFSAEALDNASRELQRHLSRRDRRQLARLAERMGELDIAAWRRSVQRTRLRAGALLAADLRALEQMVANDADTAHSEDVAAALQPLLVWTVSDSHLWARRHLGLSLRPL